MFSKPKPVETTTSTSSATMPTPPATDLKTSNKPSSLIENSSAPKPKAPPSVLSSDLKIKGNLQTTGDIQIEGEVEGNIKANLLTIGKYAKIKGEIISDELIVNGFISGTIRAKKVTLTSSAKVEGDIIHLSIAIETGAHFEGSIEKTDNPLVKSDIKNNKLVN